jgi:hypothetical protein
MWQLTWHTLSVMTKKQGYPWPNEIVTEQVTPLTMPPRRSGDYDENGVWSMTKIDRHRLKPLTMHQLSQNSDTSHICDENLHFVTDDQMWCDHNEEIQIVTNSSQMNISDDYGVFSDIRWMSLMTTFLLVSVLHRSDWWLSPSDRWSLPVRLVATANV